MLLLKRPYSGRIVTGVGIAFAERYQLPVWIIRVFIIASIVVSPIMLLVYLFFALSIPDERRAASELRVQLPPNDQPPARQFDLIASRLTARLLKGRNSPTTATAIFLLVLAALLEFPRIEGTAFYWAHPFLTATASDITWWAPILFYASAAALFLFRWNSNANEVLWSSESREEFAAGAGSQKILGGIAFGMARVLRIDPAYIRVVWIGLNILTVGLLGVVYLILWFWKRSTSEAVAAHNAVSEGSAGAAGLNFPVRFAIAILLLGLGAVEIATQERIFFFNEQFIAGLLFATIGFLVSWRGIAHDAKDRSSTAVLFGTAIFLIGVYLFSSAIGHFQINTIDRFEVGEIIGAIVFGYLGLAVLRSEARMIALYCAFALAVAASMIAFHISRPEYLTAVVRFYDFFYPIIYASLGLWITFEP